jgi:tetratricopeptide (TPR) repeat protein
MQAPRITLLQQAAAHIQGGNLGAAETLCREVLKRHRNDIDALYLLGTVEQRRGGYAGAVRCFERCVKAEPTPRYLCKLGTALAAQGNFERAIARYDQALKRDAGCAAALAGKADALDRQGRRDDAIALLEPVVAAGDEDPNIAYVYANLAVQASRHEEAIEVARRHVDNELPDPTARRRLHMTLAKAYDKLGRYDEAFAAATEGHRAFSAGPVDGPDDRNPYTRYALRRATVDERQRGPRLRRRHAAERLDAHRADH